MNFVRLSIFRYKSLKRQYYFYVLLLFGVNKATNKIFFTFCLTFTWCAASWRTEKPAIHLAKFPKKKIIMFCFDIWIVSKIDFHKFRWTLLTASLSHARCVSLRVSVDYWHSSCDEIVCSVWIESVESFLYDSFLLRFVTSIFANYYYFWYNSNNSFRSSRNWQCPIYL